MPRFTDETLIAILTKAARRINRRVSLTGTTNEIVVDQNTGEITPDNSDLEDLVLLQAECMIAAREFQSELSDGSAGLLVRDGEQMLDTRGQTQARGTFFDSDGSPCKELIDAIKEYKFNNIGNSGKMVY